MRMLCCKKIIPLVFFLCLSFAALAQETVKIWDGTPVRASKVTLMPFLTETKPQAAVVVCPGGSYCWLDYETEGVMVAEWLQKNGIAAFVLKYRTAGWLAWATHCRALFRGNQHPDMISDAQRAIQYVREVYFPDENVPLGVMGFSAGGHLAMSTACFYNTNFLKDQGVEVNCDLRPDFVAPIYPVVTFSDDCMHQRSCRALLGERKRKQLRDSLSLERRIPQNCPPVFLANCADDPVVECRNSVMLDSALTVNNIPHRYIQYKTGGHGFGANLQKGTAESRKWMDEFLIWITDILK